MHYYKIEQLHPWLYTIFDPLNVYCYLIVGTRRALLFDTCHGVTSLDAVVRGITDLPYDVVLSHGHWDHTAGAYEFDNVWLHPGDAELCLRGFNQQTRENILTWYEDQIRAVLPDFDRNLYLHCDRAIELMPLKHWQTFDLGGITVQMIPMDGHTPGSVGALIKEHRFLLDGDAANSHQWMFLEDSLKMPVYIEMLKRTAALDFDNFMMSHSQEIFSKTLFEKYIHVAQNIDIKKSTPYDYKFDTLGGYLYEEDGVGIVFDPKRLS